MSEATPTKAGGWTDTEKLGIIFQIMNKMGGKIPWSEIELPEGRTLKAVKVMLDKEKAKVRGRNNGETPATPASGKKRGPKAADVDGEESATKKRKTPSKSKKAVKASEEDDEEATKDEEQDSKAVKAESGDDGFV